MKKLIVLLVVVMMSSLQAVVVDFDGFETQTAGSLLEPQLRGGGPAFWHDPVNFPNSDNVWVVNDAAKAHSGNQFARFSPGYNGSTMKTWENRGAFTGIDRSQKYWIDTWFYSEFNSKAELPFNPAFTYSQGSTQNLSIILNRGNGEIQVDIRGSGAMGTAVLWDGDLHQWNRLTWEVDPTAQTATLFYNGTVALSPQTYTPSGLPDFFDGTFTMIFGIGTSGTGGFRVDDVGYYDYDPIIGLPQNCADAIAKGFGLTGDINDDCSVGLLDFATIISEWLNCNNPEDMDCTPNW